MTSATGNISFIYSGQDSPNRLLQQFQSKWAKSQDLGLLLQPPSNQLSTGTVTQITTLTRLRCWVRQQDIIAL